MYHAFVDESGDDGMTPKSPPWLILAALVVIESEIIPVKGRLWEGIKKIWMRVTPPRHVHFHKATHPKRKALLQLVRALDSTFIIVAAHKPSLDRHEVSQFACPALYHYMSKYLVERLTWFARERHEKIRVTFASRPQVSVANLREYFFVTLRAKGYPIHSIEWDYLAGINVTPASQNVILQSSDWLATGVGAGLNPDPLGNVETGYVEILWGKFWMRYGNLWTCGFKIIPTEFRLPTAPLLKKVGTWLEDPTTVG